MSHSTFCSAAGLVALALAAPTSALGAAAPELSSHGDAAAGHVTLQWQTPKETPGGEYLLEQSPTADFSSPRTRYQGPHRSSVLSGLPNGTYYYRVRFRPGVDQPWGAWSAPELFAVRHHSLALALALFGLGATVFVVTLAFLWVSARKAEP